MKGIFYLIMASMLFCSSVDYAIPRNTHFSFKPLDDFIYRSMKKHQVPAVSIAIIDRGAVKYVQAYSLDTQLRVTPHTLFQAASIAKSVTAYGTLLLVDKGKINLDIPINTYLKSWKVPDSTFTKFHKVTLRSILNMTSGLSVSGFAGQEPSDPLPSLQQILNGEPPAENQAVRVTFVPGTKYAYSGGGFEVAEQLIEDQMHTSFGGYMNTHIFTPLRMEESQFIAVLPEAKRLTAVPGFLKEGIAISGKWKIIPALGAGGLWSTPNDLAKFVINVMHSFNGKNRGLLSKKLATEMLTRQKNTDYGLGVVVDGCGTSLNFRKQGHNIGFYTWFIAFPYTGQGAIIMTNSENGMPLIQATLQEMARQFNWPAHYPIVDESKPIPNHVGCLFNNQ